MKMLKNFTGILMILLLNSCVNIPLISAQTKTQEAYKPKITDYRNFNSEFKIAYNVLKDDDNIYLLAYTSDYATQIKIIRLGFSVWLDEKGTKNKDKGILFPLKQTSKNEIGNAGNSRINDWESNTEEIKLIRLQEKFDASIKEMRLFQLKNKYGKSSVNMSSDSSDIITTIAFDSLNALHYQLKIPKNRIFTTEKHQDGYFSIGLISGSVEPIFSSEGQTRTRGAGAKGGGGKSGGGGRSGGGKGNAVSSPRSVLETPIKFWFRVNINAL
ncbi:MAG: hypothetical protein ACI8ZM_004297 [Crocinitomix sp.]|jgi:hypothetical protein